MTLRKSISVCLLAVYTIVVAHSLIPHHHHSGFDQSADHCQIAKHQTDVCLHNAHNHDDQQVLNCCEDHDHDDHNHTFCSFEEKTVLNKWTYFTNIIYNSPGTVFLDFSDKNLIHSSYYLPPGDQNPHCRDVSSRGPPHLS